MLQLSSCKPRELRYAAGGLRTDLRLLEVDEATLCAIQEEGVVIKGSLDEEAVLCTRDKTYALKLVETTNSLLLLPPAEDADVEFRAIPSLPSPREGDAGAQRDVGLQTQLTKCAAASDLPSLTATACAAAHIELVEVAPRLGLLQQLLQECQYSLEDEEDATKQQQQQQQQQRQGAEGLCSDCSGSDDSDGDCSIDGCSDDSSHSCEMDVDGVKTRRKKGYTTQQLLARVQASRQELQSELRRLGAVRLFGAWRLVDPAYLGSLLELLTVSALEQGWDVGAVPLTDAQQLLARDGYLPRLTRHCLEVYGSQCSSGAGGGVRYALDETLVCRHYARKLLAQRPVWPAFEFEAAWREAVPSCWTPAMLMLAGEALLLQPDPSTGVTELRVRRLPAAALPADPTARFAALFEAQQKWTRTQLDPYLEGMRVPGQTVEQLLLKHARASQCSPTDPTVVFVAR